MFQWWGYEEGIIGTTFDPPNTQGSESPCEQCGSVCPKLSAAGFPGVPGDEVSQGVCCSSVLFASLLPSREVIFHSHLSLVFRQTSVYSPFCPSVVIQHNGKANTICPKSRGGCGEEEAGLKSTSEQVLCWTWLLIPSVVFVLSFGNWIAWIWILWFFEYCDPCLSTSAAMRTCQGKYWLLRRCLQIQVLLL